MRLINSIGNSDGENYAERKSDTCPVNYFGDFFREDDSVSTESARRTCSADTCEIATVCKTSSRDRNSFRRSISSGVRPDSMFACFKSSSDR